MILPTAALLVRPCLASSELKVPSYFDVSISALANSLIAATEPLANAELGTRNSYCIAMTFPPAFSVLIRSATRAFTSAGSGA